ncbi:hypothetical protein PTKIN_Ptkin18bG0088000 [Pterospermum kingtungense]
MVEKNRGVLSSNVDRTGVLRKRKSRSESDNDLSDIDDTEITGCLNDKRQMLFKKLVWEAINKDYRKKQGKPAKGKKSTSAKTDVFSRTEKEKEEKKENRKGLSSKINYDALEKLTGEPEEVAETAKNGGIDSKCSNQVETQQQPKGTLSSDDCEEFEPQSANICSYEDEEEEYGYREDYDYEFHPENPNPCFYGDEEEEYSYREEYD